MELLNKPLNVKSAWLTAPPEGGNRLATGRQLLVAWSLRDHVSDHESGERYHLAFYHPCYGWRACRWDEEHGSPDDVLPVSESTIWVSTEKRKLIHISAGDEVRATMLASAENGFLLLYTSADNLWIREKLSTKIMRLSLQKDGLTIVSEKHITFCADLMYPLADGAWMTRGREIQGCFILSPSLEKTIYAEISLVFHHPPFFVRRKEDYCTKDPLVRRDKDYYYYYHTEDPRCGWKKMPIEVEHKDDEVVFFAKRDDVYYAAVYRYLGKRETLLYRFSDESAASAKCIWKISKYLYSNQFALYNGLVCIADKKSLIVSGHEDVPENHGFLVWNPQLNTFYEDIPQFSIMHAGRIIPRNLQIPAAWLDKDKGQHIHDVR